MKIKLIWLFIFAVSTGLASCDNDNYDAPESKLQGRIVYQGEPINVGYNEVNMQLWEPGWQLRAPINVTVDQDGSFSQVLFDAPYKLIIQPFQGPFRSVPNPATNSDTIMVNLNGSQVMDIEVLPYYMIRNPQMTSASRKVSASFRLEKIINDVNAKNVEQVALYVSKTTFVDRSNNIANRNLNGAQITDLSNISLNVDVPAITPAQNYVYARLGVKISGVEDWLYSPIQKVTL